MAGVLVGTTGRDVVALRLGEGVYDGRRLVRVERMVRVMSLGGEVPVDRGGKPLLG